MIEKKIKEKGNKGFNRHTDRNEHITNEPFFDPNAAYYDTLYRESRIARYNCMPMTKGKATLAKLCLKEIEKFCK